MFVTKDFDLLVSIQRRCGEDGQWSGKEPKCERTNCFRLPTVKHGNLTHCNGNKTNYGTIQSPKHGFCVKLACNAKYIEHWKMNKVIRGRVNSLSVSLRSKWYCDSSEWKGFGDMACFPPVRLTKISSAWHEIEGVFQEWHDSNIRWENSVSRDLRKHQLACESIVDVNVYKEKPRILNSRTNTKTLTLVCPKIRFVNKITDNKGTLETLVGGTWQRTCLTKPDTNRKLWNVFINMCTALNESSNDPGVVTQSQGLTSHQLVCSRGPTM